MQWPFLRLVVFDSPCPRRGLNEAPFESEAAIDRTRTTTFSPTANDDSPTTTATTAVQLSTAVDEMPQQATDCAGGPLVPSSVSGQSLVGSPADSFFHAQIEDDMIRPPAFEARYSTVLDSISHSHSFIVSCLSPLSRYVLLPHRFQHFKCDARARSTCGRLLMQYPAENNSLGTVIVTHCILINQILHHSGEGSILHKPKSLYVHGTSECLLKIKVWHFLC